MLWLYRRLSSRLLLGSHLPSAAFGLERASTNYTEKKNELKPWLTEELSIPEAENTEFVCSTVDTLAVYHHPHDPKRPLFSFKTRAANN